MRACSGQRRRQAEEAKEGEGTGWRGGACRPACSGPPPPWDAIQAAHSALHRPAPQKKKKAGGGAGGGGAAQPPVDPQARKEGERRFQVRVVSALGCLETAWTTCFGCGGGHNEHRPLGGRRCSCHSRPTWGNGLALAIAAVAHSRQRSCSPAIALYGCPSRLLQWRLGSCMLLQGRGAAGPAPLGRTLSHGLPTACRRRCCRRRWSSWPTTARTACGSSCAAATWLTES